MPIITRWPTRRAHFGNYDPATFGWGGAEDPEQHPDLLAPFVHDGINYGQMHVAVHNLFHNVFTDLFPWIKGGPTDGDDGCYNPRSIAASGTRSFHSWGIATDTDWDDNVMGTIPPDRTGAHVLPPITNDIARRWGCEWGGAWNSPHDFMHIECHLTPSDARRIKRIARPTRAFRR